MNDLDIHDPFRHMRSMERRLRRFFGDFPTYFLENQDARAPLIDVINKPDHFEVTAELPGVEKKDIELNVDEHGLSLRAKTSFEVHEEKEHEGYCYHERSFSSFARSIPLSTEIVPEKTSAEFKNGILRITLPKVHPDKPDAGKKIDIK